MAEIMRYIRITLFSCLAGSACAQTTMIGSVRTLAGTAVAVRGGSEIVCQDGMHLHAEDTLRTGADGRLGVILRDGTRISLGPNTELKLDRFVYEPAQGRFELLLKMARSVVAYISGKVAEFSPESAKLETPVGMVGLRGTKFAVTLEGGQ